MKAPDPRRIKGARKALAPGPHVRRAGASPRASRAAAPPVAQWRHEIKFDGYRIQARIDAGEIRLLTRTGLDWTELDSRAIAERPSASSASARRSSTARSSSRTPGAVAIELQRSRRRSEERTPGSLPLLPLRPLAYSSTGSDLQGAVLEKRKQALAAVLASRRPRTIGSSSARAFTYRRRGRRPLRACSARLGLEGIISKRKDAPYRSGAHGLAELGEVQMRSPPGVRHRRLLRPVDDFAAHGRLARCSATDRGRQVHACRPGGQRIRAQDERRRARSKASSRRGSIWPPFAGKLTPEASQGVRGWVEPRLVAEVEFAGWSAGRPVLRHTTFHTGLREDRDPRRDRARGSFDRRASALGVAAGAESFALTSPGPHALARRRRDRNRWS